jgi:acetyl-CoA acyltransferase
MRYRVAIIEGVRSPFCKASGLLKDMEADELGAKTVKELFEKVPIDKRLVDEIIFGNVMAPPHLANIARVIGIKAGLPISTPAFTVNRNCASGMEAIVSGMLRILSGTASCVVVGGVESMSHFPVLFHQGMRKMLTNMHQARGFSEEYAAYLWDKQLKNWLVYVIFRAKSKMILP